MTLTALIWKLHREGTSYLSWLVKDIIGLVIERTSYSLAGMRTERIIDTLTVERRMMMVGPDGKQLYLYRHANGRIVSLNRNGRLVWFQDETANCQIFSFLASDDHPIIILPVNDGVQYAIGLIIYQFDFLTEIQTVVYSHLSSDEEFILRFDEQDYLWIVGGSEPGLIRLYSRLTMNQTLFQYQPLSLVNDLYGKETEKVYQIWTVGENPRLLRTISLSTRPNAYPHYSVYRANQECYLVLEESHPHPTDPSLCRRVFQFFD